MTTPDTERQYTWRRLRELVAAQLGLAFPEEKQKELEQGIRSLAREMKFENMDSCARWLLSTPLSQKQVEILASHLTVGETYFFREEGVFDLLKHRLLPELIELRRSNGRCLRLWSAGCCTGEEPYSLAILLQETIHDWESWNLTIQATDINPHFLQKAALGIYGPWSFRRTPKRIQEKYFRQITHHRFEILPSLKKMVRFSFLNLADSVYPSSPHNDGAFDLIFCRNVLMYFTPEKTRQVVRHFYDSLVEGGWLVVSSSELSQPLFSLFETVSNPDAILYRKSIESKSAPGVDLVLAQEEPFLFYSTGEKDVSAQELDLFIAAESSYPNGAEGGEPGGEVTPPNEDFPASLEKQKDEPAFDEHLLSQRSPHSLEVEEIALVSRMYADRGDWPQALEWCDAALTRDRLNASLHYLRAAILQEWGKLEEAATSLKQAMYLDPEFAMAYFSLGHLYLRQGKIHKSRKQFENALALLARLAPDAVLPESEGITAGQLREMVQTGLRKEKTL